MSVEIPKVYDPHKVEEKLYKFWLRKKYFHAVRKNGGDPYVIMIPPPNITGILHMGHALNNSIQDILVRWKRMQGFNTLWMPGTDHAGIATQNVVERKLMSEGLTKRELGRDLFLEEIWKWREKYGNTIISQLKLLGSSCDWDRTRFTMDEGLSQAVQEVFLSLYRDGLIYRGNYIINWCPRCQTALSDEEAEHMELGGSLFHVRYHIENSAEYLIVATTRPETLLGDVAVAVNPKDKRYKHMIGKNVVVPIVDRKIPVIADTMVDPEFGTGALKVTPAHDPIDFQIAQTHELKPINVMNDDGTMNEEAGEIYQGMDRFECREAITIDLRDRKLLEKVESHEHSVGHCYRCRTVVEPRLSKQWFVKMKPLAKPAIEAVKTGEINFYPKRWTKVYLEWMENIRDWCISRQIWWGHRIPIWYCEDCSFVVDSVEDPKICPSCSWPKLRQDEDVLDTWFSSWLWPFSTLGWPQKNKDIDFYYPSSTLTTAQEIIFFWVARMVMAGYKFVGKKPFSDVYIHGTVRDDSGTKMSKSLGNIIDPQDIIKDFGADALRFSLIVITAQGQDVYLSPSKFEIGRNFANKVWNASRFLMMNLQDYDYKKVKKIEESYNLDDLYIIGKLNLLKKEVAEFLAVYRFNDAAREIYDFFWHHFCDRYIEVAKPHLTGADEQEKLKTQHVLIQVLVNTLKLLHPIMPFLTEEIWQSLRKLKLGVPELEEESIMIAAWPEYRKDEVHAKDIEKAESKFDVVKTGRNLRTEYDIAPSKEVSFVLKPSTAEEKTLLNAERKSMMRLLRASELTVDKDFVPTGPTPSGMSQAGLVYMPLDGLIDIATEKKRLDSKLDQIQSDLERVEKKLSNKGFLAKAPKEVVEKEKEKKAELQEKLEKIKHNLSFLSKN